MGMLFLSFILVLGASYLIAGIISPKKSVLGLIYILLAAFANLVFTFKFLSLFSAISKAGVLVMNALILLCVLFVWNKSGRPLWRLETGNFFRKFFNALQFDKYLAVLFIGVVILIGTGIFLMSFLPVVNGDASAYHVLRSVFWVSSGNLNHFTIADSRNLILPINSEILYAWIILFIKKQAWFGFVSFAGYILALVGVYNLMSGFSMRKKLWVIFLFSSFPSVIAQLSGTETDIIIAGLILTGIFLFKYGVKEDNNIALFMSSLSYALAIGTKTTALLAIPAAVPVTLALAWHYRKKEFYIPVLKFLGFGVVNFILFASYNYVLNFVNYGNIAGSQAFIIAHKNPYGLRAIPANFVKYLFIFIDFTGFKWAQYVGDEILHIRNLVLGAMNLSDISDGLYSVKRPLNQSLLEPLMGLGIAGFIMYLPCWLFALIKPVFSRNRQTTILFAFALILLINLIVMSWQLQWMMYSVRFLVCFCIISSPVIAYSYCRKNNPYKFVIVLFAMFYLVFVSTSLWARPFKRIVRYIKAGYSIRQLRETSGCSMFLPGKPPKFNKHNLRYDTQCVISDFIRYNYDKENRILFFANQADELLVLKMMNFDGYHIDFGLMENVNNIDLKNYNIIITIDDKQSATNFLHYEERKNDNYVSSYTNTIYFRKNKENPCYYFDTKNNVISEGNDSKNYPYVVECSFSKDFYKQNNLKLLNRIKLFTPCDRKLIEKYYYLYESSPVIQKKNH
ncbi:MAG: hypothetical protein LBK53_06860 [Heliobacteriaceae bacterium]|jgi:hypothetical protein|nr:hypothetical protein [Heliobacteriaceae bacterium]